MGPRPVVPAGGLQPQLGGAAPAFAGSIAEAPGLAGVEQSRVPKACGRHLKGSKVPFRAGRTRAELRAPTVAALGGSTLWCAGAGIARGWQVSGQGNAGGTVPGRDHQRPAPTGAERCRGTSAGK